MALFRGIQEYIALDANNITLVFDSGNIVNISGNIFLYPPQGHPILYNYQFFLNVIMKTKRRNFTYIMMFIVSFNKYVTGLDNEEPAVVVNYVALIGNHGIVQIKHCRWRCCLLVIQRPLSWLLSMTYHLCDVSLLLSMMYQFQSCLGKNWLHRSN